MKQKREEQIIWAYKIWTIVLIILFFFQSNSRWAIFYAWWISTAVLMMYLLCKILYISWLKKKIIEDKLQEIITERKHRMVMAQKENKAGRPLEEEK